MKEASIQDAVMIGQLLNVNKDEVWKIVKGVRFNSLTELSLLVHSVFKGESPQQSPKRVVP
jgi:hypothetical protein